MHGEQLIARLGEHAGALAASDELERVLVAHCETGEARLPARPITREAFVVAMAEALVAAGDPVDVATIGRLAAADLYLAVAIAAHDPKAIAIAEAELVAAARKSAARVDHSDAFVDEVAQRVRERLLVGTGLASYRGTGPLVRWVRVIATRIAIDLKRETAKLDGDAGLDELPAPDDAELALIWQTSAAEYKRALTAAFDTLERSERILLRQRYIDDLDLDALGRVYKVHASTVLRRLQKIESKLAERTRETLKTTLSLSESQVSSIERLVASQIQISVNRLLGKR